MTGMYYYTRMLRVYAGALAATLLLAAWGFSDIQPGWRLNPYPDGHTFAFTLVQDADSAYSRRLAPLFAEFDRLRMKITVTVFVLWADWAHDGNAWAEWLAHGTPEQQFLRPVSVPLVDPSERAFYLGLAARGHEIGIHSASETSDTTEQLERAFAYFSQVFGHPPSVYVEHSQRNNKEALENEGADPHSRFYSLGVLRRYQPWIWLDDPHTLPPAYDLSAIPGAPFCPALSTRYGLKKVFIRSGGARHSDGDGFLEVYSESHIDDLVRSRGMALVYVHLDKKWLDPSTRKMREPLRRRLEYICRKNPWVAPAGQILDRQVKMSHVELRTAGATVRIWNRNTEPVDGVTLTGPSGAALCSGSGRLEPSQFGEIAIGSLSAGQVREFAVCR